MLGKKIYSSIIGLLWAAVAILVLPGIIREVIEFISEYFKSFHFSLSFFIWLFNFLAVAFLLILQMIFPLALAILVWFIKKDRLINKYISKFILIAAPLHLLSFIVLYLAFSQMRFLEFYIFFFLSLINNLMWFCYVFKRRKEVV